MSSVSSKSTYQFPKHNCASRILLCGPSYGDITYFASFILDSQKIIAWAFEHGNSVWSSDKNEQTARKFLPIWLSLANDSRDDYFTILDGPMRQVLMPYIYDFYLNGWLSYYCHQCSSHHNKIIENDHDHQSHDGLSKKWIEEWLCPNEHIIHHKNEELRWIRKN